MGNNSNLTKLQDAVDQADLNFFLKQYKICSNKDDFQIRNVSHGCKLTVFDKTKPNFQGQCHTPQMIALNTHNVNKYKTTNQSESLKGYINYYKKRLSLTQPCQRTEQNAQENIISLLHFEIKNFGTKETVYPQVKSKYNQIQDNRVYQLPNCSFQSIFSKKQVKQPSINHLRKQVYTFNFLQQLNLDSLEKLINYRLQNYEYFREKQIWSILYCCCQAGQRLTKNGFKQPMLSPAAIFINQNCQVKVGQWQFVSYYQNQQLSQSSNSMIEQGQTFLSTDLQMATKQGKSRQSFDILTKYYWPPEGLVQIQNTLKFGQMNQFQELCVAKNSQVFSLGMTVLHLLTLRPCYKKSTYSQKQLNKLLQQAISLRHQIQKPISPQMLQLLQKMLQWDSLQRCTYSNAIDYIHNIFQTNSTLFKQAQSRSISLGSSRFKSDVYLKEISSGSRETVSVGMEITDKSKCMDTFGREVGLDTQLLRELGSKQCQGLRILIQNNNYSPLETQREIFNVNFQSKKKEFIGGSGFISQGLGDNYNPAIQDEEEEQSLSNNIQDDNIYSRNKNINNLKTENQDRPNKLNTQFQDIQENELPDQDQDFEGEKFNQKKFQNHYSQSKNLFKLNSESLDQIHNKNKQFLYFKQTQYDQNSQRTKIKQQMTLRNFNHNPVFSKGTVGCMNRQNDYTSLRWNVGLGNTSFYINKKEQSGQVKVITQDCMRNLSQIIKQTSSPFSCKQQAQKYKYLPSDNIDDSKLFTQPSLLAMIRQFQRKESKQSKDSKQSQQTPDFQGIKIQYKQKQKLEISEQNKMKYDCSKKLDFEQQTPLSFDDRAYEQDWMEEKDVQNSEETIRNQMVVKQQFQKGSYQGSKMNGARNGFGTFYYNEGGKYSGYWYSNRMDGHGTLYYPDCRIAYQGQWQNDELHGKGILNNEKPNYIQGGYDFTSFDQYQNKQFWIYYDGWFQHDEKSGYGQLLLSNGQRYVGQFKNDMIHGKGKFYRQDGSIYQGEWQTNHLIFQA